MLEAGLAHAFSHNVDATPLDTSLLVTAALIYHNFTCQHVVANV